VVDRNPDPDLVPSGIPIPIPWYFEISNFWDLGSRIRSGLPLIWHRHFFVA
jgi:hypothetical protein